MFLHGLEHGGLGFGGGAVDFVGEDDVGEDGAFHELELASSAAAFLDDVGAGDVGGHQVGGELDAVELEMEGFRDGGHEECFGETGNTHEEGVAATEETNGESLDDVLLTDDDLAEFRLECLVGAAEFIDRGDIVRREGGGERGGRGVFADDGRLGGDGGIRCDGRFGAGGRGGGVGGDGVHEEV